MIDYYDVFAKHRFDDGYNTELKVKITPANELPVHVQSPATLIQLKNEIFVDLA